MKRTLNADLKQLIGSQALVKGWIHTIRDLGKLMFVILRDRSGVVQVVIETPELLKEIQQLQVGSVISITGDVKQTTSTKEGYEIIALKCEVISAVTEAWPVEINKDNLNASLETVLDYRPLTLRHKKYQAIFKVQATLVAAYREFLTKKGFVECFGPNIIGASSEGGSEMFKVQYFDNEALLSQSAQLYKQMMVGVNERVFALMKCFRAEKSNTRRHLTEATQFEFEMGFIEDYHEVMDYEEQVIKYMVNKVTTECAKEIAECGLNMAKCPMDVPFPRIKFRDALQLVFERTGLDERNEKDLSPMAEGELCKYAREEFGTDFIFVENFLRVKTAFYAKPNAADPSVTNYFDLLCREIEIASGGQRIEQYDELVDSLKFKGMDPNGFSDYLSIFKYGMPKHGGFGLGMERFTMMLLGLDNIRESTLFPSDPKRIAGVSIAGKLFFGDELHHEIIKRLDKNGFDYQLVEHEAVQTSSDAAKVRATKLEEGVKAIILKGKKSGKNIMVCLPANEKVDLDAISKIENEKFEFEKADTIKLKFGLEVGAIPPFANLMNLTAYFAKSVLNEKRAAFNCGYTTKSVIMQSADLVELVNPILI